MHHIIPPPGCKQAPSVLNGALSSPGGFFIAPLRLYTHEAKLVHCIFLFRKSSFLYPRYSMRVRKGVDPQGTSCVRAQVMVLFRKTITFVSFNNFLIRLSQRWQYRLTFAAPYDISITAETNIECI